MSLPDAIEPDAAVVATLTPSMYSFTLLPLYVPITKCHAPLLGTGALAEPTPGMSKMRLLPLLYRRYCTVGEPFCTIAGLPLQLDASIQAPTESADEGFRF